MSNSLLPDEVTVHRAPDGQRTWLHGNMAILIAQPDPINAPTQTGWAVEMIGVNCESQKAIIGYGDLDGLAAVWASMHVAITEAEAEPRRLPDLTGDVVIYQNDQQAGHMVTREVVHCGIFTSLEITYVRADPYDFATVDVISDDSARFVELLTDALGLNATAVQA